MDNTCGHAYTEGRRFCTQCGKIQAGRTLADLDLYMSVNPWRSNSDQIQKALATGTVPP